MKKYDCNTFIAGLVMSMLFILCMCVLWFVQTKTYTLTTVVVSVNYNTDTVETEDFNGNVWTFNGCEGWQVMDVCTMLINDNNTITIYDDVILSTRHNE